MKNILKFFLVNILDFPKTLYFNYYYFGLKGLKQFPVFVSHKVKLLTLKGEININCTLAPGLIRIGYPKVGIFDFKYERTIWEMSGELNFDGYAFIGQGSRISVSNGAKLSIGKNFVITSSSTIVCNNEIKIGDDCLLSWKILFIDTDYHVILYNDNQRSIQNKPIMIGNKVWIGCETMILKGTIVGDGCVIGAKSLLMKNYKGDNKLISGNPASIIKDIKSWVI